MTNLARMPTVFSVERAPGFHFCFIAIFAEGRRDCMVSPGAAPIHE